MIMSKFVLCSLTVALSLFSTVRASAAEVEFLRAKLVAVRLAPDSPGVSMTIDGPNPSVVPLHSAHQLIFRSTTVLVGPNLGSEFSIIRASATPVPGNEYYLLVERDGGSAEVVWSSNVHYGICLLDDVSKKYGIYESINRLKDKFPCQQWLPNTPK
jgi:hypothetical protein